jgi:hypothetical protein
VRLDHLLSKEHTPRRQANVLARMVVFTSGIVDARPRRVSVCAVRLCAQVVCVGFEYLLPSVGWGWGQAHCWVLKDQPRARGSSVLLLGVGGLGVWVGVSVPPFASCLLCAGVWCLLVVGVGGGRGCWWGCCLRSA